MIVAWWPFVIALMAIIGAAFRIRDLRQRDAQLRMTGERLRLMKAQLLAPKERVNALRRWVEENDLPLVVDDFGRLHARHDDVLF